MGPLALVGTGLARLSGFIIPKKPWLQLTLCAGLLLILGLASWQRTWAYESEETLWTDTLTKNPISWLGHNNLGLAFLRNEQRDGARMHFQKALEINPNYVEARSNLGLVLFKKRQPDEAMTASTDAKTLPLLCLKYSTQATPHGPVILEFFPTGRDATGLLRPVFCSYGA